MRAIVGKLDLNFKTVRRYLRADTVDSLLAGGIQTSVLDPFKPYLHDRLADGERDVSALLIEINGRGYTGGYSTVDRDLRPLRCVEPPAVMAMSLHGGAPAVVRHARSFSQRCRIVFSDACCLPWQSRGKEEQTLSSIR